MSPWRKKQGEEKKVHISGLEKENGSCYGGISANSDVDLLHSSVFGLWLLTLPLLPFLDPFGCQEMPRLKNCQQK